MAHPKVSVVVPVYNTERYLAKCLDTLVSQTLDALEILVVNDGSPDNSQEIIDSYASANSGRVVSLTKPNGGLSDARNYGAERARGDFIGFIDSDDYIEPQMFERLYLAAIANEAPVAVGQYIHYGLNDVTSVQGVMNPEDREAFTGIDFLLQQTSMVVWNKLYHSRLVRRFPFPNTWFEDVAWTPVIMTHVEKFAYVPEPFYHYIRREDSIASSHHDPRTLQGIQSLHSALANSKPERRDAVAYMAARRLLFEARVRKCYADKYLAAFAQLAPSLRNNQYFLEDDDLRARCHVYLNDLKTIPKRIYYSHFGERPSAAARKACIASWTTKLVYGDGDVVRLDETNCDVTADPLIAKLYRAGSYKAVGDYFKLTAVIKSGGVGLADNVLANDFIAPALINEAFFSQSPGGRVFDGAFGAVANHADLNAVYDRFIDFLANSTQDPATALQESIEAHLRHKYGALLDERQYHLAAMVMLYGAGTFHSKYDDSNIAVHVPEQWSDDAVEGYSLYSTKYVDDLIRDRAHLAARNRSLQQRLKNSEKRVKSITDSYAWRIARRFRALEDSRLLTLVAQHRVERAAANEDSETFAIRAKYARQVDREPIDNKLVLLESFYGRGLLSNPFALFEAWTERIDFSDYRFVWVLDQLRNHTEMASAMRQRYPNVSFVERATSNYYAILARAKYLVNDVTFYFDFVKKQDQVYINPWHSITVKSLGYDIPQDPLNQKNVVRNFLSTSYFAAANDFVRDRIFYKAHLMDGIFPGVVLGEGHPRNDLTLRTKREEIIAEMQSVGLEVDRDRQTLVFAPTWRGTSIHKPSDDLESYSSVLAALNAAVGDRYNVLIRLHHSAHANLPRADRLRRSAVPPTIDANRMFAATDVLVTDYSSIFFDYLVTDRPILFYIPDLEEYRHSRGVYFDISELPGPATDNLDELVSTVTRIDVEEEKYGPIRKEVAKWAIARDDGSASSRVLARILDAAHDIASERTGGPRVLFHAGSLKNKVSLRKLKALLTAFKPSEWDISILVTDTKSEGAQRQIGDLLAEGVRVIGRSPHITVTRRERYLLALSERRSGDLLVRWLSRAGEREWRRCLGDATFDLTINLDADPHLLGLALADPAAGMSVAWLRSSGSGSDSYSAGLEPPLARRYDQAVSRNAEFEEIVTALLARLHRR